VADSAARTTGAVMGVFVDAMTCLDAIERIVAWSRQRQSRYVVFCNVHMIVTASRDEQFMACVNGADMVSPDGQPVAWMLRRLGFRGQDRISGPDLMEKLVQRCARDGIAIFLLGSTEATLEALVNNLLGRYRGLRISGSWSPPFRPMSAKENEAIINRINASGAGILFVGLGCPKQENWMAAHRSRVDAVMLGVGAAFDFHANAIPRAPAWMRRFGLEWLHRLASEPRRLWRRYLTTNALFIVGVVRQLWGRRRHKNGLERTNGGKI
jgi:N-acetylglucosaminyldiphosphoundecaprenol N-acetyl-beta-D-mannosaminyltransferase